VGNILLVIACLLLGMLARRSQRFPDATPTVLSRVVIDLALPALTLLLVPRLTLDGGAGLAIVVAAVAVPWLLFALALGVLAALARARGWSRATLGALVLTSGLANTAFVGFPLIEALYGARALPTAILVDQAGSFVVVSTAGVALAAACAGRERPTPAALARRLASFPPFLAFVLALLLHGVIFPPILVVVLEKLSALVVPLALLSVGYQLRFDRQTLARDGGKLGAALAVRLALAPLVVWLCLRAAGLHGEAASVIVAQSAMGPMVTGAVLAVEEDLDPPLATLIAGVGIPLSLVTVPLWTWLLRML
jgi:predicted permease